MALNRNQMIESLSRIKKNGVDISPYMREMLLCEDGDVPYKTIAIINKYEPIDTLFTYNKVYENRRKNPLYKNLVNESLPLNEKAIALSSLSTQILIHMKDLMNEGKEREAEEFAEMMDLKNISESILEYTKGNDEMLIESAVSVRKIFKTLF